MKAVAAPVEVPGVVLSMTEQESLTILAVLRAARTSPDRSAGINGGHILSAILQLDAAVSPRGGLR